MTNAPFRDFLIVFDASTRAEPEVTEFLRSDAALEAYHRAEDKYRGRREIHVVLLGSDSLDNPNNKRYLMGEDTHPIAGAPIEDYLPPQHDRLRVKFLKWALIFASALLVLVCPVPAGINSAPTKCTTASRI